MSGKHTLQDPHLIAGLERRALGQLDQTIALALTQVINDLTSNPRRSVSVHDEPQDPDAPARGIKLCLNNKKTVAREKRRPNLDPAAMGQAALADPRQVRHEPGQGRGNAALTVPGAARGGQRPNSSSPHPAAARVGLTTGA